VNPPPKFRLRPMPTTPTSADDAGAYRTEVPDVRRREAAVRTDAVKGSAPKSGLASRLNSAPGRTGMWGRVHHREGKPVQGPWSSVNVLMRCYLWTARK
jgi:hypothetical protein